MNGIDGTGNALRILAGEAAKNERGAFSGVPPCERTKAWRDSATEALF